VKESDNASLIYAGLSNFADVRALIGKQDTNPVGFRARTWIVGVGHGALIFVKASATPNLQKKGSYKEALTPTRRAAGR